VRIKARPHPARYKVLRITPGGNNAVRIKARPHPSPLPQERETISSIIWRPLICDYFKRSQTILPLLGERAGVRARFSPTESLSVLSFEVVVLHVTHTSLMLGK